MKTIVGGAIVSKCFFLSTDKNNNNQLGEINQIHPKRKILVILKFIKSNFMAFKDIFKDSNDINEKNVVGFASFTVMALFATADVITGIIGNEFIIDDTIFNSFVIITLGSFGIDGITKIFAKKEESK